MDIVIVGAGLGGLAAALAIRTASAAHKVLVIEATARLTEVRTSLILVLHGMKTTAAYSGGVSLGGSGPPADTQFDQTPAPLGA